MDGYILQSSPSGDVWLAIPRVSQVEKGGQLVKSTYREIHQRVYPTRFPFGKWWLKITIHASTGISYKVPLRKVIGLKSQGCRNLKRGEQLLNTTGT